MTHDQRVLARMGALAAITRAMAGPQADPRQVQQEALGQAIAGTGARLRACEDAGLAGTAEHLALCSQATRWGEAWRLNR